MNETIELMKRHRSIRAFKSNPIPDEHIHQAIEAGQMASTSSAIQAYCLIRITDPSNREALIDLTGGQPMVASCGAFFVVCGDSRRHRLMCQAHGQKYDARFEAFLTATVDAGLFAQNLVLAFESMGYGICYVGGLRTNLAKTSRLLKIPEGVYPLFGLCVGQPVETPSMRPRLPLDAVYFEDQYPDDEAMLEDITSYEKATKEFEASRGLDRPSWSERLAEKFSTPRRPDVAPYYRSQGADLT